MDNLNESSLHNIEVAIPIRGGIPCLGMALAAQHRTMRNNPMIHKAIARIIIITINKFQKIIKISIVFSTSSSQETNYAQRIPQNRKYHEGEDTYESTTMKGKFPTISYNDMKKKANKFTFPNWVSSGN